VQNDILAYVIFSLANSNGEYKKACSYVFECVSKHSAKLASDVIKAGALEPLIKCLEDFDPLIKQSAVAAVSNIAHHDDEALAKAIVDAKALPLLVQAIQQPDLPLKMKTSVAFGEISKHSAELSQLVVDSNALQYLTALVSHPNAELKKNVCWCLSLIAKHSIELAEAVATADLFPKILNCLKDSNAEVRYNSCKCIRKIAKRSQDLAMFIVQQGGPDSLVEYLKLSTNEALIPGIKTLGSIASYEENFSTNIINAKAIFPLKDALLNPNKLIQEKAAWALGEMGKHTPDHAKSLAESDVLPVLFNAYKQSDNTPQGKDLTSKARKALKMIIEKCTYLPPLLPILCTLFKELQDTSKPDEKEITLLKCILGRFANLLPSNTDQRK
jgi:hypothetical protein